MKFIPDNTHRRVDNLSKRFTGAGWMDLPQELVDEILGYLRDDLAALKACSLTCKHLFGATRPLIHQRLCLATRLDWMPYPKPKVSLFGRRKRPPEAFGRLIDADRSGLLRYTRHLTFKIEGGPFVPSNIREYLPHLRSITELHGLTFITFCVYLFIPVFDECFGMFASTLRHLDIRIAHGTEQQLLYIICQFPLLEDLNIVSPVKVVAYPEHPVPTIIQSPPLRGKLVLAQVYSAELFEGLAALPSGLNFRSLELFRCGGSRAVLAACGHSVTSISYLWYRWGGAYGVSNYSIHMGVAI